MEAKQCGTECWKSNNLAQMYSEGSNERQVKDTLRPLYEGPEVPGCVVVGW